MGTLHTFGPKAEAAPAMDPTFQAGLTQYLLALGLQTAVKNGASLTFDASMVEQ